MDIIEINKKTQKKKVAVAEQKLFEVGNKLTTDQSLILVLQACKKYYGLQKTVKIIHGLGVKNFDLSI